MRPNWRESSGHPHNRVAVVLDVAASATVPMAKKEPLGGLRLPSIGVTVTLHHLSACGHRFPLPTNSGFIGLSFGRSASNLLVRLLALGEASHLAAASLDRRSSSHLDGIDLYGRPSEFLFSSHPLSKVSSKETSSFFSQIPLIWRG